MGDFSSHIPVTTAVSRNPQTKLLEILLNAQAHRIVRNPSTRFDLKPFAFFAIAPLMIAH
jgi:hypothetical protein